MSALLANHDDVATSAVRMRRRPRAPGLPKKGRPARGSADAERVVMPSFEALYDDYVDFVWRSARRHGVSASYLEDVVQEVFMVVHRRQEAFEGRSSVRTWLYGITLHVVKNHRRQLRRRALDVSEQAVKELDQAPISERQRPDVIADKRRANIALQRILTALPAQLRDVLVMAEIQHLSAPEIAKLTGLKTATVYGRLRTARAKFNAAVKRLSVAEETSA